MNVNMAVLEQTLPERHNEPRCHVRCVVDGLIRWVVQAVSTTQGDNGGSEHQYAPRLS